MKFSLMSFLCDLKLLFIFSEKPKFLTKEERAAEALRRRHLQVEEQRKHLEVFILVLILLWFI